MKQIKVFNPEHDLALANGNRHFIAPRNIREMACDLAPLLDVMDDEFMVWGWDGAVKERLHRMGIADSLLPTDEALLALRACSERQSAHRLLQDFHADYPEGPYAGESIMAHDMDTIAAYALLHGHVVLKDPLSSSGKGLRHVNMSENENTDACLASGRQGGASEQCVRDVSSPSLSSSLNKVANWANALINRHGYLTAEPYYNKVQDFAMEFCVSAGQCRFIGYSLFNTNSHGRYESNLLVSDEEIEALLVQYVAPSALYEVQAWVIDHFSRIIPTEWNTALHSLYFGIDMMIVDMGQHPIGCNFQEEINSRLKLHPCVEINLRLNMGIIAHEVRRKLLAPTAAGTFHVASFPTGEAAQQFYSEQVEKFPLICQDGKISSGYYPLTPIHSHTRHHAYVICEVPELVSERM